MSLAIGASTGRDASAQDALFIADGVGWGKTIEQGWCCWSWPGGRADRVLIARPAGLQEQWVEQM